MSWPYPHGRTVQVLDGSGAHVRYGQDPWTWPVKKTYRWCAVGPRDANGSGGSESTFQQDTVESGRILYGPPNMSVNATDRIRIDDIDYDIVGEPQTWPSPYSGWNPGTVVALQKAH